MRSILHSCTSNSFSGLERYVLDIVQSQGETSALFCRENSPLFAAAQKAGVKVISIPEASGVGVRLWFKVFHLLKSSELRFDVLHLHHAGELRIFAPVLQMLKLTGGLLPKVVLQFHLWTNHKKRNPYHSWLYSFVDEVWCSTKQAQSWLTQLLPAGVKIAVIPYGRPVPSLEVVRGQKADCAAVLRKSLGLVEDSKVIVTAARFETIKGIHELFDGFVQAKLTSDWNLVLIGAPSPSDATAQASFEALLQKWQKMKIDDRSLSQRIHFLEPCSQEELWRKVSGSDVYALPSYEECFSLALVDAVLLGLPALGTASGGTPSLLCEAKDGVSIGVLVAPRNARAVSEGLQELVKSFVKRKQVLREILPQLQEKYSQEHVMGEIFGNYQKL